MDQIWIDVIVAVVTAVLGVVIGWIRRNSYDEKIVSKYQEYEVWFDIFGLVIKALDEDLYIKLKGALDEMARAYDKDFTTDEFNNVVKSWSEVFEEAKELIAQYEKKASIN